MAIDDGTRAEILRLHKAEGWSVSEIARHLGLHRDTVKRALAGPPKKRRKRRASKIDPFVPFIMETLEDYPRLKASRLHEMCCERGYKGGSDRFRHVIAKLRPRRRPEAFLRVRMLPGEQAQVDWGEFGKVQVDRAVRKLSAFSMVLSYSRHIYFRFYFNCRMGSFMDGHLRAFEAFGGVPRCLLYDNLKSVVTARSGRAILQNRQFLQLASHYCFLAKAAPPRRGNEKGRVERSIGYIRSSFFPARKWRDLDDLNAQARAWCEGKASDRLWPEDRVRGTVREAFGREMLLPLPDDRFPAETRHQVKVGKRPYARFDLNDYSVPPSCVGKSLVLFSSPERIRIFDGQEQVASHRRIFDRGRQIEDEVHIEPMVKIKKVARRHWRRSQLMQFVPASEAFLVMAGKRGHYLSAVETALLEMLRDYGADELTTAIGEATAMGAFHAGAVQSILSRRRDRRGMPPVPLVLPEAMPEPLPPTAGLDAYDNLFSQKKETSS